MTIKIYEPDLTVSDRQAMIDAIDSGWVSSIGPYVQKFESRFSEYTNIKHCSSCSNGTVALHLALLALGITSGHRVGVPSFTYIASVNAISYVNATPVILDVCKRSWNIDVDVLSDQDLDNLDCIIMVDIYGLPSLTSEQYARLRLHNVLVVNDCAESLGSQVNGTHVGSFCDIATFSFFGNKTITTGEGGMVAANDSKLIERVNLFKNQGRTVEPYLHYVTGYNYRLTNVQSALGYSQLSRIDDILSRKKKIFEMYVECLRHFNVTWQDVTSDKSSSHWLCAFTFEDEMTVRCITKNLKKHDIESRPFFTPIEALEMYKSDEICKNSHFLYRHGICLPSHPNLSERDVSDVLRAICEVLQ